MKTSQLLESSNTTGLGLGQLEGDLRLISDFSSSDHEIFLNNTVCSDGFDMYEADLACSQLGYLYVDRMSTIGYIG